MQKESAFIWMPIFFYTFASETNDVYYIDTRDMNQAREIKKDIY